MIEAIELDLNGIAAKVVSHDQWSMKRVGVRRRAGSHYNAVSAVTRHVRLRARPLG